MTRKTIDFLILEAGCLIYVADRGFGGYPLGEFHEFFGGVKGLQTLTENGAVIAGSLYQDDGYNVRVVFGDLTEQEDQEWTSRIAWKLKLDSGQMVVSGVCDEDLEETIEDFPIAEDGGEYDLGAFVEVPPGEYAVSIHSYPPGDLAGGWMRIENKGSFRETFGRDTEIPYEKPVDYFNRTRPGETPRDWIKDGWENANFLGFVIQLTPLTAEPRPLRFEDDGCTAWEYRKPAICPVGIELASSD